MTNKTPGDSSVSTVEQVSTDDASLTPERRRVLTLVGQNKAVLEVGAHDGHFSRHLISQGCRVTAVERSSDAAELARGVVQEVLCGDFENEVFRQEIPNKAFDVVLFMHVLEHLIDPWTAIRETGRLVRPGGSIIILLPNVACWRIRKELFLKGRFEYADSGILDRTHLRFFTLSSGMHLLKQAGYENVCCESSDTYIPLENRFRKLFGRTLAQTWRTWMLNRFPNLCTEVFLFHIQLRPL